jgi:hypothetical protein
MTWIPPCPLFTLSFERRSDLRAFCVNPFFSPIPSVQVN